MTIDRDDRQARLEWMIDEFQQARRRTDGAIARSVAGGRLSAERLTTS